jgi:cell pole-organizing protein PopZ
MPFETFFVVSPRVEKSKKPGAEVIEPSLDEVANRISETYNRVAEMGGKIVASYTLDISKNTDDSHADEPSKMYLGQALFLVADIPEMQQP